MHFRPWREKARELKIQVYAVYLASRDPRVPRLAKIVAVLVVGYAFSPIDLIPDFIPVLGYLDDLVVVPLGVALVLRMIPADVMAECRERSRERMDRDKPVSRTAALVVVAIWVIVALLVIRFIVQFFVR